MLWMIGYLEYILVVYDLSFCGKSGSHEGDGDHGELLTLVFSHLLWVPIWKSVMSLSPLVQLLLNYRLFP